MEQFRLLLAVVLSFLVFVLWMIFNPTPTPQKKENSKNQETVQPYVSETGSPEQSQKALSPPNVPTDAAVLERTPKKVVVTNGLYHAVFTEKGAGIESMSLTQYKESIEENSAEKELILLPVDDQTVLTHFDRQTRKDMDKSLFTLDQDIEQLDATASSQSLRFVLHSEGGLVVEKIYSFTPNNYLINMEIVVKNGSNIPVNDSLVLTLKNLFSEKTDSYGFEGASGLIDSELNQVKLKKNSEIKRTEGSARWIALEDRYFMTSIIPVSVKKGEMRSMINNSMITSQLVYPLDSIPPNSQLAVSFNLFLGPKSMTLLKSLGFELNRIIYYGWFDVIARPCLWVMNLFYELIPNYGVAIILLTIFTKLLFWPLGSKSYKSMNQMRRLQPLMTEIREKYKDDKHRMNQEMMALYKTYRVNPLGGCLPMLLQLPIFFALYRMLFSAIELRHAPFMLWINDLSAPDRLFHFSFSIPFMTPPYGIPVLTLIMGATTLLQQKMSPQPGDPAQAKMMMIMPVVLIFIFINFSSGLVLYWLVSNILSIAQQYFIQKKNA